MSKKAKAKKTPKKAHGMQMGGSGFGMTHGYGEGDAAPDTDNSHEFKGTSQGESAFGKKGHGATAIE